MEVIAMLDPAPSPEAAAAIRQELQNREPVGIVRVEIPGVKVNQVLILENPDGTLTGVKLETTERGELCTAGEFLKSELPWLILGLLELAEETALEHGAQEWSVRFLRLEQEPQGLPAAWTAEIP